MTFFVPGLPQPAGSKQVFQHPEVYRVLREMESGKPVARPVLVEALRRRPLITDDNRQGRTWRQAVAQAAIDAGLRPSAGPLVLCLVFLMPRPKGHFGSGKNEGKVRESAPRWPAVKPDVTKLARGTEDALKGIAWKDDSQVVAQAASKHYADPGEIPGCWVTVREAK